MKNKAGIRVLVIILYLLPIILVPLLTQNISYFSKTAGILTVLLGIFMGVKSDLFVYKKNEKNISSSYIFLIIAGICLLIYHNN